MGEWKSPENQNHQILYDGFVFVIKLFQSAENLAVRGTSQNTNSA
jgi:hypothetical protein